VGVVILLLQRALLPAPRAHEAATEARNPFDLLRYPAVRNVLIVSGMISMSWDLQQFLIPVYGTSIGLSASQIGLVLGAGPAFWLMASMLGAGGWTAWRRMTVERRPRE
jgi:predicted MFS family arabinose efflux permease